MKKLIILIPLVLLGYLTVLAQDKDGQPLDDDVPKGDTTKFRLGKSLVIIIDDTLNGEMEFECEDSTKQEDEGDWGMFMDFGMNGYMTADNSITLPANQSLMELDYTKSWTIGFTTMYDGVDLIKDRLYISPGFGITWNNYFFENNIDIGTNNSATTFTADTIGYDKYKLRATYLQVPLVIGGRIGNLEQPLSLQAGVIGSYNLGGLVKQKYNSQDTKLKAKIRDDYNLNPFRFDAIARIAIGDVGLFARYSLTTLFEENKAYNVYPFSVGFTFGEFTNKKK